MADAAPALRLGVFPLAALAIEFHLGTPLPFLVPLFAALLLTGGPQRPPVMQLVQVLVLILAVTVGLGWIFGSLAHSPASVWLILLAIVTLCFARLSRAPRDLLATLALSVASLVTVLLQVSPELPAILPWLMGRGFLLGALTAWLAFALLPGNPLAAAPPPVATPDAHEGIRVLLKGAALVAVLAYCIAVGDTSAILIATTVTNLLAAPDGAVGMAVGRLKLRSNLLALAAALPVLVMVELRPEPGPTLLLALAVCLLAASGASRGGARAAMAAMAMPVLLTLLGLYIPTAAEGTGLVGALWDRMFSLLLAVAYGLAVHALLRRPAPA